MEEWVAERIRDARARVVAVEDTCTLGFYDELNGCIAACSMAVLMPRLHGDLVKLRAVKDAEEVELMRAAQKVL